MKLVICGDSFMSPAPEFPNAHFAEIFAKHYNFELVTYSRASVSNFHIGLQIDQALIDKPDLIMFNFSNCNRIEIDSGLFPEIQQRPITLNNVGDFINIGQCLSDNFYKHTYDKNYIISFSLSNFDKHTVENFVSRYPNIINKVDSVKSYIVDLYNEYHKKRIDNLMMYATVHRLYCSTIPFIFVHDYSGFDDIGYNIPWINENNSVHEEVHDIRSNLPNLHKDPGFHLSFEASDKIAELLIQKYKILQENINIK